MQDLLADLGIPAPRLLAFGQRKTGSATADSFALYEPPGGIPLAEWLADKARSPDDRREVLTRAGRLLREGVAAWKWE